MKRIILKCSREEVFRDVELSSGYRAVRNPREGSDPGSLAMGPEDRRLANCFFDDLVGRTLTELREFARGAANGDSDFEVALMLADSWNEENLDVVNACLRRRMSSGVLARWLEISGHPDSEKMNRETEAAMREILSFLYQRNAPSRYRRQIPI